jgi:hypothetical protein
MPLRSPVVTASIQQISRLGISLRGGSKIANVTPTMQVSEACSADVRPSNRSMFLTLSQYLVLLRTLPNHYTANSTFTWFALMTPEAMQDNLTKLGIVKSYSFERPGQTYDPIMVNKFKAAKAILQDRVSFGATYGERAREVMPQGTGWVASVCQSFP